MAKTRQAQLMSALLDFYRQPVARVSLELILSILAVVFFAIFAIRPTLLTMADLVKEIADKRELDKQMDLKIASLSTAEEQYQKYETQFYLLDQSIPRQFDLVRSLKIIEKLAGEDQLVLERISLSAIPDPISETVALAGTGQFQRDFLLVNLDVTGDYLMIKRLVEKLINLRQLMIVDQVSFDKETDSSNLSVRIRVNLPYYALATAKTAVKK